MVKISTLARRAKQNYYNYTLRDGRRVVKHGVTNNPYRRTVEMENQKLRLTSVIIDPVAVSERTARKREIERIKAYQRSHRRRKPRYNK